LSVQIISPGAAFLPSTRPTSLDETSSKPSFASHLRALFFR